MVIYILNKQQFHLRNNLHKKCSLSLSHSLTDTLKPVCLNRIKKYLTFSKGSTDCAYHSHSILTNVDSSCSWSYPGLKEPRSILGNVTVFPVGLWKQMLKSEVFRVWCMLMFTIQENTNYIFSRL
uniref:Uncharacterized protein n=1 Tax=Anguilla anguilla TaxID=7936 RepID=A0A0E9WQZ8_ANGAN